MHSRIPCLVVEGPLVDALKDGSDSEKTQAEVKVPDVFDRPPLDVHIFAIGLHKLQVCGDTEGLEGLWEAHQSFEHGRVRRDVVSQA